VVVLLVTAVALPALLHRRGPAFLLIIGFTAVSLPRAALAQPPAPPAEPPPRLEASAQIVRYSNEPPIGFETTDTITSVALVWAIKRPGP
jgi:hypothetical protein